jgi:hypothetical protein
VLLDLSEGRARQRVHLHEAARHLERRNLRLEHGERLRFVEFRTRDDVCTGSSPRTLSGTPTTAASRTPGCSSNSSSISRG